MTTGHKLLLLTISGSLIQHQLVSVWMSVACVTTGVHAHHVLNDMLKYKGPAELTPLLIGPE